MLIELPRQTIFERRRKARRDLWLLLGALLAGQVFFFGCLGVASQLLFFNTRNHNLRIPELPFFTIGAFVGLACWLAQLWLAFRKADARIDSFTAPDPEDERHQTFVRQVADLGPAVGLRGMEARIAESPALNSFCWQDGLGGNFIGMSEGLLARLTAQEMLAVAAHHATHLAYGDQRLLKIAASGPGIFEDIYEKLCDPQVTAQGGRTLPLPAWVILTLLAKVAQLLMRILFSIFARERVNHADAGAVAMTRDPLSLAQALLKSSSGSAYGLSMPSSLSPLLLVEPGGPSLNSHPALEFRLRRLTSDAGVSYRQFIQAPPHDFRKGKPPRKARPSRRATTADVVGIGACPRCGLSLEKSRYEGVSLQRCVKCDGHFLQRKVMRRLIARREEAFSLTTHKRALALRKRDLKARPKDATLVCELGTVSCPGCGQVLKKRFFDLMARVPVDQCENPKCEGLWLDGEELELIQVLHERPQFGMTLKGRLRESRNSG